MSTKRKICRGDIYVCDMGTEAGTAQNGIRPVLVLQSTNWNENSGTTVVAAISTSCKKEYLPSHVYLGDNFGLQKQSTVFLEQLRTVDQCELGKRLGHITDEKVMKRITIGLKRALGLFQDSSSHEKDVRCLCPKCLDPYFNSNQYVIRRVDPFQKSKEPCEICGYPAYDYYIYERKDWRK